ncbi:MAG: GNAT family N-acetyltransferase [Candidatus Dormibacteraeota bacterium]|nr:GNAT family N-acetyltransferase [Candidatus Dormibacteraeota bacterium]
MPQPAPSLLELDGFSLHRMATADLPFVLDLYQIGPNRLLVDLPAAQEEAIVFLQQLEKQPWSMLMVAQQGGKRIGALATGLTNLVSLNTYLLAMFLEPAAAMMPLALFTRHLFWTYPLERLYVQFPLLDETEAYGQLYEQAGFQREGVMKKHQSIAARRYDVAVYGLLREDFDRWCTARDPRLAL